MSLRQLVWMARARRQVIATLVAALYNSTSTGGRILSADDVLYGSDEDAVGDADAFLDAFANRVGALGQWEPD